MIVTRTEDGHFPMPTDAPSRPRIVVIGLDGVPCSFLRAQFEAGRLPNLARLAAEGEMRPAVSVQPPVSSAAWVSFATSRNPARHDIFGFIDRRPGTYDVYIPDASHIRAQGIWELLGKQDRRVCAINVPGTYPPHPVNGIIVGDFLAPELKGATYPPNLADRLATLGYKIDVDPWIAHKDLDAFVTEAREVLRARTIAALELLGQEPWDLFMGHLMETDRINHFLWRQFEQGDPKWAPLFLDFYAAVDEAVGKIAAAAGGDAVLFILSDHGFGASKKAVFLNTWLEQIGWLAFDGRRDQPRLTDISADSRAYCLDPSRFYINLRSREPGGRVERGDDYEHTRDALTAALLALRDPEDGSPVIRQVFRREDIYRGVYFDHAPDLVADPHDGYDLRGRLGVPKVFDKDVPQTGTHRFDDAFWLLRGARFLKDETPAITDGGATILKLLGLPLARDMDGVPRAKLNA
jgi:predicted AlkP superfamily phosphohydrolase/phosphomutase